MKWIIKEFPEALKVLLEETKCKDYNDLGDAFRGDGGGIDVDTVVDAMKKYAEEVLKATATQARVQITDPSKPDGDRKFSRAHYNDKGIWARACPHSIVDMKKKLK